jgi:hypothetical protein
MELCDFIAGEEGESDDSTFKKTEAFIRQHRLPKARLLAWFKQHNVSCDRDIMVNLFLPISDVFENYLSKRHASTSQQ